MTPRDVADRLAGVQPVSLQAVALALWLLHWDGTDASLADAPAALAQRAELLAQIEAAQQALAQHARAAREAVERCCTLRPQASHQTPLGF